MGFSRWLRVNAEHYLLRDAQTRLSATYGRPMPPPLSSGPAHIFWTKVFVPAYRMLPWTARRKIMLSIPGSHRKGWTTPPHRHEPANVTRPLDPGA